MILGLERAPEEGKSYPLQYRGLKNSMDCSGEFHALYSPWGRKESDITEQLSLSGALWSEWPTQRAEQRVWSVSERGRSCRAGGP